MADLIRNKFSGLTYKTKSRSRTRNEDSMDESSLCSSAQEEFPSLNEVEMRKEGEGSPAVTEKTVTVREEEWSPPVKRRNKREWRRIQVTDYMDHNEKEVSGNFPIILSSPNLKLADISPMKLKDAIASICLPGDKFEIKYLSGGDLVVVPSLPGSSELLMEAYTLNDIHVVASKPNRIKYKRCVIRNVSSSLTTQNIIEELEEQGIANVALLCKKAHETDQAVPHRHSVLLETDKPSIPDKIYLFHEAFRTLKYKEKPMLCQKCNTFGHLEKHCSREYRCSRCKSNHHVSKCSETIKDKPKCINCGGSHEVESVECKVRRQATKAIRGNIMKKSYAEIAISNRPTKKADRAQAPRQVRGTTNKNLQYTKEDKSQGGFLPKKIQARNVSEISRDIFRPTTRNMGTQCNTEREPLEAEAQRITLENRLSRRGKMASKSSQCNVEIVPRGISPTRDVMGEAKDIIDQEVVDEIYSTLSPLLEKIIEYLANRNSTADRAVLRHIMACAMRITRT